jgi:hypothetical protein
VRAVLLWEGKLCIADTFMSVPVSLRRTDIDACENGMLISGSRDSIIRIDSLGQ